jgi:hypothetical protein
MNTAFKLKFNRINEFRIKRSENLRNSNQMIKLNIMKIIQKLTLSRSKMKTLNSSIMYIYLIIGWNIKVNFNEVSIVNIYLFILKSPNSWSFSSEISRENKNQIIFIFEWIYFRCIKRDIFELKNSVSFSTHPSWEHIF